MIQRRPRQHSLHGVDGLVDRYSAGGCLLRRQERLSWNGPLPAVEIGPHNVRVNAIAPGWIESAMLAKAMAGDPKRAEKILGRTPMNRFGEPADIGAAAVYLCSPAAKFVTGVILPVDGGASIGF